MIMYLKRYEYDIILSGAPTHARQVLFVEKDSVERDKQRAILEQASSFVLHRLQRCSDVFCASFDARRPGKLGTGVTKSGFEHKQGRAKAKTRAERACIYTGRTYIIIVCTKDGRALIRFPCVCLFVCLLPL
jgi:hypothetical protein